MFSSNNSSNNITNESSHDELNNDLGKLHFINIEFLKSLRSLKSEKSDEVEEILKGYIKHGVRAEITKRLLDIESCELNCEVQKLRIKMRKLTNFIDILPALLPKLLGLSESGKLGKFEQSIKQNKLIKSLIDEARTDTKYLPRLCPVFFGIATAGNLNFRVVDPDSIIKPSKQTEAIRDMSDFLCRCSLYSSNFYVSIIEANHINQSNQNQDEFGDYYNDSSDKNDENSGKLNAIATVIAGYHEDLKRLEVYVQEIKTKYAEELDDVFRDCLDESIEVARNYLKDYLISMDKFMDKE